MTNDDDDLRILSEIKDFKELLINALEGRGFGTKYANVLVTQNLAIFTGNQHNEDWSWNLSALQQLNLDQLVFLYNRDLHL